MAGNDNGIPLGQPTSSSSAPGRPEPWSRAGSSTRARASCCSRPAGRMPTRRSTTRPGCSSCGTASRTGATARSRRPPAPGRELHWPRGKVLGGSSALNGMIYARGHRSDYDTWAYLGNDGWGYEDVLPLFKRSEDFDRGASAYHGVGGPLHVLSRYEPHPVNAAVVAAAQEAGHPVQRRLQRRAARRRRVRAAQRSRTAGARPARRPSSRRSPTRLASTVLTGAHARRLLFEGARCVGVEIVRDGAHRADPRRARGVVCAGTVESPKLLLLSGIGAADELGAPRHRRRRRPPGRRAQPARPRALARHLRRLAAGAAAVPGLQQLHSHSSGAAGPGFRARHPAALLPPSALPRGHGGPARRLHADGRDHPAREPRRRCDSPRPTRPRRR